MKVSLISPYSTIIDIGIRILSAVLRKEGHDVKIIFLPKNIYVRKEMSRHIITPRKEEEKLQDYTLDLMVDLVKDSDLIGISLTTNHFYDAVEITKKIKDNFNIPVVWGGAHPTAKPEECLKYADFVCRGEGEEAIVELVKKIEKKEFCYIKNICYKNEKGVVVLNPPRALIQNLDSIPFPDYSFENKYLIIDDKVLELTEGILEDFFIKEFREETYITYVTRGCVMGCSYCNNSSFNKLYCGQKIFRIRSVDNVIKELIQFKKYRFVKNFWFIDDSFLGLDIGYIKEFSEKYKKDINLPFGISGVHPVTVSRDKLKYLTEAGLMGVRMGIQSGNERIKKTYKRYYPNSKVKESCEIISEFKDKIEIVEYDVIVDNPWETESELIETFKFLTTIPLPHIFIIFSLTFYPGTELYERAKSEGLIKDEIKEIYRRHYWETKKSYINNLFFLLSDYSCVNKKIHPIWIKILTNSLLRKTWLSYFLYYFLRIKRKRVSELS